MMLRLMTYNILDGGAGREKQLLSVIKAAQPDVVILQELANAQLLEDFATELAMQAFFAEANVQLTKSAGSLKFGRRNLGLLSKFPIVSQSNYRTFALGRALLEATIEYAPGQQLTLMGVHLRASLALPLELWRIWEVEIIKRRIVEGSAEKCLVAGDFNTLAPGDQANVKTFPPILKLMHTLQFGQFFRFAIPRLLATGYTDCYRKLHPTENGYTLPTPSPNTRLDYIFASPTLVPTLRTCEVVKMPPEVNTASDHFPVIADFEL